MSGLLRLRYAKTHPPVLPAGLSFSGQTILITGGTGGLGFEAAVHFVQLGARRVIITGRTLERGEASKAAIEKRTSRTGVVEVRVVDMDSYASCEKFVDGLKKEVVEMDYVLLNAGALPTSFRSSQYGVEQGIQVNVLSTTLLALLMLPWLQQARPHGRQQHLSVVSSGLHTTDFGADFFARKNYVEYYSQEQHYPGGQQMYAITKLLVTYTTREIARRAALQAGRYNLSHYDERRSLIRNRPSVIVNYICPGACKSELARDMMTNPAMRLMAQVYFSLFARSTEDGAKTLVLAATTTPEQNGLFVKHYGSEAEYKPTQDKLFESSEGKQRGQDIWEEVIGILRRDVPNLSV